MKTVTYLWKHLSKSEKCALFDWKDNFVSIKMGISNQSPQAPVSSKWISNSTWQDVHQLANVCKIWAQCCALMEHIVCVYWMINTVHGLTKLVKYFTGEEKNLHIFYFFNCFRNNKQIILQRVLVRKIELTSMYSKTLCTFSPCSFWLNFALDSSSLFFSISFCSLSHLLPVFEKRALLMQRFKHRP